jgi:hypothetical protein
MGPGARLQIIGLDEVELLELEEEFPDTKVDRLAEDSDLRTQHGDLGLTAAVVIVTAAVVHGLSVWLAKRRVEDIKASTISYEKLPDGTIRFNLSTLTRGALSESPDAKVVQGLKSQLSEILQPATTPKG